MNEQALIKEGRTVMAKRRVDYTQAGIKKLAEDKPVVYRIQNKRGKDNYVGSARRGQVIDRISEHLGKIPGATVTIQQFNSLTDARIYEQRIINRSRPNYNR